MQKLKKGHLQILFISVMLFLVFFRAKQAFRIYSDGDDLCYMQWLFGFLGEKLEGCPVSASPGIAVFWTPSGLLGVLFSKIAGFDLTETIPTFVGTQTYLLWIFSFYMVYETCKLLKVDDVFFATCFMLSIPVLFYATHRTTMAHVVEFSLGITMAYFIAKERLFWALVFCLLFSFVRINDAPSMLIIVGALLDQSSKKRDLNLKFLFSQFKWHLLILLGAFLVAVWFTFVGGFNGGTIFDIFEKFKLERLPHIFLGADMGLLWTASFWVLTLVFSIIYFKDLSWKSRAALPWLLLNIFIYMGWGGHGSEFAYRYLIGSYVGSLFIGVDLWRSTSSVLRKIVKFVLVFNAVWLTYLTYIFKTAPETMLYVVPPMGWNNLTFQFEALKILLKPKLLLMPLSQSPVPVVLITWFLLKYVPQKIILTDFRLYVLTVITLVAVYVAGKAGKLLYDGKSQR